MWKESPRSWALIYCFTLLCHTGICRMEKKVSLVLKLLDLLKVNITGKLPCAECLYIFAISTQRKTRVSLSFLGFCTQKKASAIITTSNVPNEHHDLIYFTNDLVYFTEQSHLSSVFWILSIITYRCWTTTLENHHLSNILTILHCHCYYILISCNFPCLTTAHH